MVVCCEEPLVNECDHPPSMTSVDEGFDMRLDINHGPAKLIIRFKPSRTGRFGEIGQEPELLLRIFEIKSRRILTIHQSG